MKLLTMFEIQRRKEELRTEIINELAAGEQTTLSVKAPEILLDQARWAEAALRLAGKGLLIVQEDDSHHLFWGINQNVQRETPEFFRRSKAAEDRINGEPPNKEGQPS